MSNQCCSIRMFSLFFYLIANNVNINAQHLTPQPQFRSSALSAGFVNTFNGGFSNARSISSGSFLQSTVQTNTHQGQELSNLNDGSKNKPTQPVISFVIPSYASGITHILDLSGKLPVPSDSLLPPIGLKSPINSDNEINSRALLPIERQTLQNFISTTSLPSFPIADIYNKYNLLNVTPVSLSSETNAETTATPATVQPIEKHSVINFNSLFQPTISTIESTTSAIPKLFFITNSSKSQNSTEITQQNVSSTDILQESTSLSPEAWRRLLILGEQKTPGYAIRSDGSIDSKIGFEKIPITTATPILLPVLEKVATTSLPQTTVADFNDNPFLPPLPVQSSIVNNQFNTQNRILNKNSNELSISRTNNLFLPNNGTLKSTNQSNSFAAFKFTISGFQKNTTASPIVRNQPTHAPFFGQTTNSRSTFAATKTTNSALKPKPNISKFIGFTTNFASNVSAAQPPTVRTGFEFSKNIPVLDNNPLLPPITSVLDTTISNFTFKNQVNIRNGISINENQINFNNPVHSQAAGLSAKKAKIDSFPSTSNPFNAFKFTVGGFYKNTTSSPASFFSQTTNSENILTATEIKTATSNSVPIVKPTASSLNRFPTNLASNVTVAQVPKVQDEIKISENIPVPDNNPFLPPLVTVVGIAVPNFAFNNQANNQENIQTTSIDVASTTEKFKIDYGTNQSIENPTTTLTDGISDGDEIITTETSYLTLIEKSTIQPTSQSLSTFLEPETDSIAVEAPPNFPNNDLLPPLSSESSINVVENNTENSSFEISNNPFVPTLDLNPFLAPFSSNPTQTVPQQISSIPSPDVSITTKPNTQFNFTSKFDNSALRNNFFVKPNTQANYFKYTGGFGAPPGILSPHDKKLH